MSFFNKISRMFGFGNDSDADEFTDETTDGEAPVPVLAADGEQQSDVPLADVPTLPEIDPDMKARIFEGVVDIFNKSLPEFLARSVDPAVQRRLLLEAMDKSASDYLSSLMLTAEQYAEKKLKVAVDAAHRESEKLKTDMAQLEQQRSSLREAQLSADRRRRALSDRVNDLESKLATAEAEREQFELENKSLLNKLKVADVQPALVEDLTKEVERLKAALAAGGADDIAASADNGASEKIEVLEKENAALVQSKKALEESIEELTRRTDALEKEKAELEQVWNTAEKKAAALEDDIKGLRQQQGLSQGMYDDLQSKFVAERDGRVAAERKLAEAEGMLEQLNQFQEQLGQIEEVIRKRDERIEKLKNTNHRLRDDNESLRRRLEEDANLFAPQPSAERTVEPLDEDLRNELSAIEDDFECPGWFVAASGPGPMPLHTEDPNFGYQEPVRKPRKPESDAQLSLF